MQKNNDAEAQGALWAEMGAKGGKARAKKLSTERRKAIASKAAEARWGKSLPVAIYGSENNPLRLGGASLPCYVLDDETRVLTQEGFLDAIGRARKAKGGKGSAMMKVDDLPPFLAASNLVPFIDNDLRESTRPIVFRNSSGVRAFGYRAALLPAVCNVYLEARDRGQLLAAQAHIAKRCEILVRALAKVGIDALVDEATGYQEVRARNSLAQLLEAYVAKELQRWVKTFPPEFYEEMFRLREWTYDGTTKRPILVGKLTNEIVYRRLPHGVLEELKKNTERDEAGRLKTHLHRRLTPEFGHPRLREVLGAVVAVMRLSDNWHDFMVKLDRAVPRQDELPLLDKERSGGRPPGAPLKGSS